MNENMKSCNFLADDVIEGSEHYWTYRMLPGLTKKRMIAIKQSVISKIPAITNPAKSSASSEISPLDLQPGEWVEVKTIEEISRTLDWKKRYKGLYFMPEMKNFCGKKFKVFKKVEVIKLESTGEVRKLKSPTVFLEGVYCNGEHHDRCDRACFHFWKEAWLKKISSYLAAATLPLAAVISEFGVTADCDYCFLCLFKIFTTCSTCPVCNILHSLM